jgi:hypothetical protein
MMSARLEPEPHFWPKFYWPEAGVRRSFKRHITKINKTNLLGLFRPAVHRPNVLFTIGAPLAAPALEIPITKSRRPFCTPRRRTWSKENTAAGNTEPRLKTILRMIKT